mmetsp:Transcript_30913/g.81185  ORF Transcript_30913/g.81185 Transcript_30913/m.81185 type:complete len:203 (-) Transcript_30913:1065-1673(-)
MTPEPVSSGCAVRTYVSVPVALPKGAGSLAQMHTPGSVEGGIRAMELGAFSLWYDSCGLLPMALMKFSCAFAAAENVKYSAVAPWNGRVNTTMRCPPTCWLESTVTEACSCLPGLWSCNLRSVTPPSPSTMTAHGSSPIEVALNPTPNHTPTGPVMLIVTSSVLVSIDRASCTNDLVLPSSRVAPAPHAVPSAALLKKTWTS